MTHDDYERRFSEETLRAMIRHATALQQQRDDTYSEPQVRSILADLGVPQPVVEQVLQEAQPSTIVASASPRVVPVLDSAILGVATGLAAATALPFVPGSILLVPAMWGAGLMFSGILSARNAHQSIARFQTANFALWFGMGGTFLLVTSAAKSMLAASAVTIAPWAFPAFWVFSSVAGAVLSRYDGSSRNLSMLDRIANSVARFRSNAVRAIKKWAESLTARSGSVNGVSSHPRSTVGPAA